MSKTNPKNPIKKDTRIDELQTQIASLDENWKRALADYQNLLRRVDNDRKEFTKISNANLIARLLPSLDIIELAANHNQDLGVQMAAKQFHQALVEEGLELITPAIGESFDPKVHDCNETVDLDEGKVENTISELVLKGYKLGDYVLRPAKVKVYKNKNI
jgi:molecular chaperone GrpE